MLPRSIAHSTARHVTFPPPCTLCSCTCGSLFLPQRRSASSSRKAPSTYAKARQEKSQVLTATGAKERKALNEHNASAVTDILANLPQAFRVMTAARAAAFLQDFEKLVARHMGRNVNKTEFQALVKESGLPMQDLFNLNLILVNVPGDNYLGKKLMFALSVAGLEDATISICSHALLGNKVRPNLLRSAEIVYARGHLKQLARYGKSYRAMVLEGKIMRALGDEDEALAMWEKGMGAAVARGQRMLDMKRRGVISELQAERVLQQRDSVELSSPWIELTLLRYDRYVRFWGQNDFTAAQAELEKAEKAADIGCRMDDPTSHYHKAEFFKKADPDGTTKHTSVWLYHMTKAATSGHAIACHKLGIFYAESGWKYIDDEPPDHVKPTPFDSYPSDSTSLLSTLQRMFTFFPPQTATEAAKRESDDLFHTAAFPSTPQHRWLMASHWLKLAMQHMYAPSYLYAAQMLVHERYWAQAQAPKAALHMTAERYKYANKADYEAKNPIVKPNSAEKQDEPPEDPLIPRTASHTDLAKTYLTQVFNACTAHSLYLSALAREQKAASLRGPKLRSAQQQQEPILDESALDGRQFKRGEDVSEEVMEWFRFPDVREMWSEQAEGLAVTARGLCDERGWDLVGRDGGLVYSCRKRGVGGSGGEVDGGEVDRK
ncbi:hypothetical protein LTR78_003898 [Recurvomyces mirabilis]|uniref:Uncharacterized protein n=1 Tax=Recurvomyces mirabilis TaxID=574656 RepID=A0AAE0WQI9_9PEZI|nr:hypothetical protein LTR78_003898 [Recurvomyces mirabilis]KAK5153963.1 hypothetical protein LTS14_007183 [Recurvomyces mirabilis]